MSGTDIVQIYCAPMVTLNLIYAGEVAWEGVVFRMRSKEMYTGISLTNIIWQKDMEIHIVKAFQVKKELKVETNSSHLIYFLLTCNKILSRCYWLLSDKWDLSRNNGRKWIFLYSFNSASIWIIQYYELEEGHFMGRQFCSSGLVGSNIASTWTHREYGSKKNGWYYGSSYCWGSMFYTNRVQVQNERLSVRGYADIWYEVT